MTLLQIEALNYVLAVQSTYGESDRTFTDQEDSDNDDDCNVEDADVETDAGGSYNLRN